MRLALALVLSGAVSGCGSGAADPRRGSPPVNPTAAGQSAETGLSPHGSEEPSSAITHQEPTIRFVPAASEDARAAFEVAGIAEVDLAELAEAKPIWPEWTDLFSVRVAGTNSTDTDDRPAMLGSYSVADHVLRFKSQFALQPGLRYRAVFNPSQLPTHRSRSGEDESHRSGAARQTIVAEFAIPKLPAAATTIVTHVFPSAHKLPENQLKFYLHFSAPMSRGEAYKYLHLMGSQGSEVDLPFLELDEELWNPQGTRFTVLFDPGRIKRGLKPREEFGPILEEGRSYTLVIDRGWRDAAGNPLKESARKNFEVGPPDDEQPNPKKWQIQPPLANTLEPLVLIFPKPLDHAMLERVITVTDSGSNPVPGHVAVQTEETRWLFTPAAAWQQGRYQIVIDTALEDLAGNSIDRPFEVDVLRSIEPEEKVASVTLEFRPAPASPPKK